MNTELNPWNRTDIEKLSVDQLIDKLPTVLAQRICTDVCKNSSLAEINFGANKVTQNFVFVFVFVKNVRILKA
jgi:hypothetical protein